MIKQLSNVVLFVILSLVGHIVFKKMFCNDLETECYCFGKRARNYYFVEKAHSRWKGTIITEHIDENKYQQAEKFIRIKSSGVFYLALFINWLSTFVQIIKKLHIFHFKENHPLSELIKRPTENKVLK